MIIVTVLFMALLSGIEVPKPGPVAWSKEAVPKSARESTESLFVHTDGPGCSVQFLKPGFGGGVVLSSIDPDQSISISIVERKPAFLELGLSQGSDRGPRSPTASFAYCIEAVKRGKVFTPALRTRFLGFGGIK